MYIETLIFRQNSFLLNSRNHHCMGFVPNSKSFVPDTPSFYDHIWSRVELFSETLNIRWYWSIWKSLITATALYLVMLGSDFGLFLSIIPFKTYHSQVELQLLNPIIHSPVQVEKNTALVLDKQVGSEFFTFTHPNQNKFPATTQTVKKESTKFSNKNITHALRIVLENWCVHGFLVCTFSVHVMQTVKEWNY